DRFMDVIVKADDAGRTVRLRDVANVEFGVGGQCPALLDGQPVAALVVHATGEVRPERVRTELAKRLAGLPARFPPGLELDATFNFTANWEAPKRPTTPEYLLLDVDLPASASAERTQHALERCQVLRQLPGVEHLLTLPESPFGLFSRGPCILV